jgi:hypothetical protein
MLISPYKPSLSNIEIACGEVTDAIFFIVIKNQALCLQKFLSNQYQPTLSFARGQTSCSNLGAIILYLKATYSLRLSTVTSL